MSLSFALNAAWMNEFIFEMHSFIGSFSRWRSGSMCFLILHAPLFPLQPALLLQQPSPIRSFLVGDPFAFVFEPDVLYFAKLFVCVFEPLCARTFPVAVIPLAGVVIVELLDTAPHSADACGVAVVAIDDCSLGISVFSKRTPRGGVAHCTFPPRLLPTSALSPRVNC